MNLDFSLHLAPMRGITDVAFRALIAKHAKSSIVTYSEMISAYTIVKKTPIARYLLEKSKFEKRYGIQIFGNSIEVLLKSARVLEKSKDYEIQFINFNFGCPSKKIIKNNSGASWLKDINNMIKLSKKLRKDLSIAYSFKTRLGFSFNISHEFAKLDVDELIVHARTAQQEYSGKAQWQSLYELKHVVNYPIIGNGDIFNVQDAFEKVNNLDGIMIARGILSDIMIIQKINHIKKQIKRIINVKKNLKRNILDEINTIITKESSAFEKLNKEKIKLWFEYYDLALCYKIPFSRLKLNSLFFVKNLKKSKILKQEIMKTKNHNELHNLFSKKENEI